MYGGYQPHLPDDIKYVNEVNVAELSGDFVVSDRYRNTYNIYNCIICTA